MSGTKHRAVRRLMPSRTTAFASAVVVGMSTLLPPTGATEPAASRGPTAGESSAVRLTARTWPVAARSADLESVRADIGALVRSAAALSADSTTEPAGLARSGGSDADASAIAAAAPYIPIVSDLLWIASDTIVGVSLWIDDWVDFGVDVATVVAGYIPGIHLFAEQIQIVYYTLLEPLVMVPVLAFADFLTRWDPVFMVSSIIEGYVDGVTNFLSREYWYLQSFPAPWPRFPVGLPLPPGFLVPEGEIAPATGESVSELAAKPAEAPADPQTASDPADVVAEAAAEPEEPAGADVAPDATLDEDATLGEDTEVPAADGADETPEDAGPSEPLDEPLDEPAAEPAEEPAGPAAEEGDTPGPTDSTESTPNGAADASPASDAASDPE